MKRRKEQIKIAITDELRSIMDARAQEAGHSLSEEARILLWAGLATMRANPDFKTHTTWKEPYLVDDADFSHVERGDQ